MIRTTMPVTVTVGNAVIVSASPISCSSLKTLTSLSGDNHLRHHHHDHNHNRHSLSSSIATNNYRISARRVKRHTRSGQKLGCTMQDIGEGVASDACSGIMIYELILEAGVFRFDCSVNDKVAASPSLSFVNSEIRDTPLMSEKSPSYIPTFESFMGQQTVQIVLPAGTSFYGTGEVSGQLERTGKRIYTWNTDAWGYGPGTTSLYQSHPWVLSVLPNGEALGVLADTTRRCEVDLRKDSTLKFVAASSYPIITFGPFASPVDVLVSLSHAIGTIFMPPKWSLGYHQCRWGYDSDKRVLEVASTFREKGIPCDVIWMDIDYMDGYRCFTFDHECFPDPNSMVNNLHLNGFKAIWMLDPGIKHERGYFVYDSGAERDAWIRTADERPYIGEVWPGPCVFPDFTQSKVRSWWANLVKDFISNGVDGIWNDMNEPAVLKVVTKTMPETNMHVGDPDLGGHQNHAYYHNVYGMLMARSTYEGMKLAHGNKRPFVLTRAGFVGSQRYAATWTGDNFSTWEHLHMSVPMVLQLGLSGQPFSGPDIGGYAGNATPKLFGRWMGIGAMFPFCRAHSAKNTVDHEPWSFGEECEEVCRLALKRRYRLIPHLYTLFYLAHTKGTPVASPTFFADPKDVLLRTSENSFLLGPLLIHASTLPDQGIHQIYPLLPRGIWMSFDFDDSHPDLPAMYLRGGSIIPIGLAHQHVGEANPTDDLTLLVALDEHGKAVGVLFEDDGDGYAFTHGSYLFTTYTAQLQSSVVTIKASNAEGSWKRPKRQLHVQLLLGGGSMIDSWGNDGEEVQINMPSETEVSNLVLMSQNRYRTRIETVKHIPEAEATSGKKGAELSQIPVELKSGDWVVKVVPWIGGRIIAMDHQTTGIQWLQSTVEIDGYEEYSDTEYRSPGCSEEYVVIEKNAHQTGVEESLKLEGDIGGGLFLERYISIHNNKPRVLRIESNIIGRNVGVGSGGFSRLVCLRVHPVLSLPHRAESYVSFISIDGSHTKIQPQSCEKYFEGNERPNGEWMLVDKHLGVSLVNRFDINEVHKCLIHWGAETVDLELWSEHRPVSKQSPLRISHEYEVRVDHQ